MAVDDAISFTDLKGTLEFFVKEFFGKDIKTKFIPHFFPFTEPSAEVLVSWKDNNWLEILGCGMVDPNVFEKVGFKKGTQGFAFGVGVERLGVFQSFKFLTTSSEDIVRFQKVLPDVDTHSILSFYFSETIQRYGHLGLLLPNLILPFHLKLQKDLLAN